MLFRSRWRPVVKLPFPVSREAVAGVFGPAAPWIRSSYTDSELVEAVGAIGGAQVVEVDKSRTQREVNGCTVELAALQVGKRPVQTAAVEGEDPEAVRRMVRRLGLEGRHNTNYVRALTQACASEAASSAREGAQS